MSNYESEYFFIRSPRDLPTIPSLMPDNDTSLRPYSHKALPLGEKPLVFYNYDRAERLAKGIKTIVPDVMFDGTDILVSDRIREKLLDLEVPNLHIYPAIYINDDDKWHENYWFLTFTKRFDCWDRDESDYDRESEPVRFGDFEGREVYTYRFSKRLLDETPLKDRLLFKMGGTLDAMICAHYSILTKVFGDPKQNGARYQQVDAY